MTNFATKTIVSKKIIYHKNSIIPIMILSKIIKINLTLVVIHKIL